MKDLIPINGHIIIQPKKHESFIVNTQDSYDEIGVVLDNGGLTSIGFETIPEKGDEVFFDSFLAAKYPTGNGDEYFWLVKYEDIRAIRRTVNEKEDFGAKLSNMISIHDAPTPLSE